MSPKLVARLHGLGWSLAGLFQMYPIFHSQQKKVVTAFNTAAVTPSGQTFETLVWLNVLPGWIFLAATTLLFITAATYETTTPVFNARNARRIIIGGLLLVFSGMGSGLVSLCATHLTGGRVFLQVGYLETMGISLLGLAILTLGFKGNELFQRHNRNKATLDGIV